MNLSIFFDGPTLLIVLGGTALATALRCGLRESRVGLAGLVQALRKPDLAPETLRARLAPLIQAVARDGLLRARYHPTGEPDIDGAVDTLLTQRALAPAMARLEQARSARAAQAATAAAFWAQAADLAPVFGLAGTLVSLTKLPAHGIDRGAYMAAIGMAVHATLYGLMAAHLVLMPLARLVARHALLRDGERVALAQWLEHELAPHCRPRGAHHAPPPRVAPEPEPEPEPEVDAAPEAEPVPAPEPEGTAA